MYSNSHSLLIHLLVVTGIGACQGFVNKYDGSYPRKMTVLFHTPTSTPTIAIDERTGKRTGTSFLPSETIERASKGSPIEKIKLDKDGTSAFVDVYEYAAKIRSGEMTWEEVEKADLDTVSMHLLLPKLVIEAYFQSSRPKKTYIYFWEICFFFFLNIFMIIIVISYVNTY